MSVASYINYHRAPFTKFMSISEYNEKHQAHIPQNAEFEAGFRAALADARRVTDPHDYIQHHFNVEEMRYGQKRNRKQIRSQGGIGSSLIGKGTVKARGRPPKCIPPNRQREPRSPTPPYKGNTNDKSKRRRSSATAPPIAAATPSAKPRLPRQEREELFLDIFKLIKANTGDKKPILKKITDDGGITDEEREIWVAMAVLHSGIRSWAQYDDTKYHTSAYTRFINYAKQNFGLTDLPTPNDVNRRLYQIFGGRDVKMTMYGLDNPAKLPDLQEFQAQLAKDDLNQIGLDEDATTQKQLQDAVDDLLFYVEGKGKNMNKRRNNLAKATFEHSKSMPTAAPSAPSAPVSVSAISQYLMQLYDDEEEEVSPMDVEDTTLGVADISLDDVLDEYGEEAEHYEEATTGVSSLHEEIDTYLKSNAKDDASFARDRAHVVHFNTVSTHLPSRLMKGRDRYMKRLKAYLDGDTSAKVRMMDNTEVLVSALSPNRDSLRALLKASSGEPRFCECA